MLARAFRLTDKLGVVFLKTCTWLGEQMLSYALAVTMRLRAWLAALYAVAVAVVRFAAEFQSRFVDDASTRVTDASTRVQVRSQRRAAAITARLRRRSTAERLEAQVRALSAFSVVLLIALMGYIMWSTGPATSRLGGGASLSGLPPLATRVPPATLVPTPAPTATPVPDPLQVGGSIVYTLRTQGQDDLYAVVVGRGEPVRLTDHAEDDRDPAWAPDGVHLAFASHRDGNWELYVLDTTGGAVTRLTDDPDFQGAPSWSPDGQWIVYESYKEENLDLYILKVDGAEGPYRLTYNPWPDMEPVWSPGGRHIAYTSWQGSSPDIYVLALDNPNEQNAANLTNTPDLYEDYPAWSPDGLNLAYSAYDPATGIEMVEIRPFDNPGASPIRVGQGSQPAWAPNGGSVVFAAGRPGFPHDQLIAGQFAGFGAASAVALMPGPVEDPDWSGLAGGDALLAWGGAGGAAPGPLYEEQITYEEAGEAPRYRLIFLNEVKAPEPYLSDRVNDSFDTLRAAALSATGFDFLGTLGDAWWRLERRPEPGQEAQNWHYAGRAFALNRNLILGFPPPVEVVREETGIYTAWRVYVRGANQSGRLGEPLRRLPWDFEARTGGDIDAYNQGGTTKPDIPAGYYVDFTKLAHDYGWERVPADRTWVRNYGGARFWEFVKTQGLTWAEAMLEIYPRQDLDPFLGQPTPVAPEGS
ncbi:MAG: PD40 domain-containing protein [Anaerolineae bacterium]|nr:PD40 domain-containing protein [Anaerolineae bacterium]